MSNDDKKALRITVEAHERLKKYCDETGRTQVEVLSELTYRHIKPELDRLLKEKE
jgi:predicted DNA-binding protein